MRVQPDHMAAVHRGVQITPFVSVIPISHVVCPYFGRHGAAIGWIVVHTCPTSMAKACRIYALLSVP